MARESLHVLVLREQKILSCHLTCPLHSRHVWIADSQQVPELKSEIGGLKQEPQHARKLKVDVNVANVWPEFGTDGKNQIKVNHILSHTTGLNNALANISEEDPMLFCDRDEYLKRIAMVAPETEPEKLYHYLPYGWLCGGMVERASEKKFQDVLEEAFVRPLNVEGELYIGILPGVECRLTTLTIDMDDLIRWEHMYL